MTESDQMRRNLPHKAMRWSKPVVFVLALCTTVFLFSIPIVLYYVTLYTGLGNYSSPRSHQSAAGNSSIQCDSISWGNVSDRALVTTECEPYKGTICLPYLIQWNQCILPGGGDQEEIYVAVNSNGKTQTELDQDLLELRNNLQASFPECLSIAIPFLCHYNFPLMAAECQSTTVDDDQPLYTVTQEDCINIRDTICPVPWQLAETLGYSDRLPDCQSLPTAHQSNNTVSNDIAISGSNATDYLNDSVTCRFDFILINNTCYPRCDRFQEQPSNVIQAMLDIQIVASVISVLLCITAFSLAAYNRKKMLKFPSYFLLFLVLDVLLLSILYLIIPIDRSKLLCSSVNLIEALNNPTFFCTFTGAIFHYIVVNMAVWWFFHFCVTYYDIMFPFHSHEMKSQGRRKYLAIVLTVLGFLLPIPAVGIALGSESSYGFGRLPPDLCIPSPTLFFYSCILPFTIMLCICVCFLISIFWIVHKQKNSSTIPSLSRRITSAERKIIIVAVHFIIFGVFVMIHNGIVYGNEDKVSKGFREYFLCESIGHIPGRCDRSSFESFNYPQMTLVAYILMGTFPAAILNFIVNWESLWNSLKHQWNNCGLYQVRLALTTKRDQVKPEPPTGTTFV